LITVSGVRYKWDHGGSGDDGGDSVSGGRTSMMTRKIRAEANCPHCSKRMNLVFSNNHHLIHASAANNVAGDESESTSEYGVLGTMSTHSDRTWTYNRFTVDDYHDKYFEIKVDEFLDFAYSIVANVDTRNINGEVELCIKCPCVKCKVRPYRTRDEVKYHLLQKGFMHGYTTWWEHGETDDTFEHVGQSSNANAMKDDDVDAATHMELDDVDSEGEEPLYAGCQNWTKLQAATRVLSWK
ncbi:transposon, En/Spm-like, transposase-associated domain protein, partial [Tanacetum coccineum]